MAEIGQALSIKSTESNTYALYSDLPLKSNCLSIRLLTLLPGDFDDPIECRLKVAAVTASTHYEALSYTWGDERQRKSIKVNGEAFSATANLEEALRGLRYTNRRRVVWADAVCIDQADVDERSAQVQEMGYIFQCAYRVLVWLGEGTAQTSRAIAYIKRWSLIEDPFSTFDVRIQFAEALDLHRGLIELSERRWWTRVWVVQEVARASSDPLIGCGRDWCSWTVFVSFMEQIGDSRLSRFRKHMLEMNSMREEVRLPPRLRREGTGVAEDDLFFWMRRTALFEATDPRDKIIALIGLARSAILSELKVYYSISAPIFTSDLFLKIVQDRKNLDFLALCGPGHDLKASWLPDLKARSLPSLRALEPSLGRDDESTDGRAARQKWLALLERIGSPTDGESDDARSCTVTGYKLGASGMLVGRVSLIWIDSTQRRWYAEECTRTGRASAYRTDVRMSSGDDWDRGEENRPAMESERKLSLRDLIKDQHGPIDPLDTNSEVLAQEQCRQKVLENWEPVWSTFAMPIFGEQPSSKYLPDRLSTTFENHLRVVEAMRGRYQFVTDSGLIGIGPFHLTVGDAIVLLHASRYAFALRPVDSGKYNLVGAVCVCPAGEDIAAELSGQMNDWRDFIKYDVEDKKFEIR